MKKEELKTSQLGDLKRALIEAKKELIKLQTENEQRKLKNVKAINFKRKDIARIATFLRQKELQA